MHVHADADELGKLYRPTQAIHATPQAFAAALNAVRPRRAVPWKAHTEAAHAEYLAWSDTAPIRIPGNLQMGQVMQHLKEVMPADTIFCNGAGSFATWIHRFWPFTHLREPAGAHQWVDGLRPACGRGRQALLAPA